MGPIKKKYIFTILLITIAATFIVLGRFVHKDVDERLAFWSKLLQSDSKMVQVGAIRALGDLRDLRAGKIIFPFLNNTELWIRVEAVRSLGKIKDPAVIDDLIEVLNASRNPPVRREAALSLGLLGDQRAVNPLIMQLKNENNALARVRIIEALGYLRARQAASVIRYSLHDKDIWVRRAAYRVLQKLQEKR